MFDAYVLQLPMSLIDATPLPPRQPDAMLPMRMRC